MSHKKSHIWITSAIVLGVIAVTSLWLWIPEQESAREDTIAESPLPPPLPTKQQTQSIRPPTKPLFGENLLRGYGSGVPTNDLRNVQTLISNYRMLAKGMDARHFSSNGDVAATLRGEKRIALAALPKDHSIFNEEGLIIDRWDTPLFFHLEAADKLSIYSAGPDKEMGTEDDFSLVGGVARQQKAEF